MNEPLSEEMTTVIGTVCVWPYCCKEQRLGSRRYIVSIYRDACSRQSSQGCRLPRAGSSLQPADEGVELLALTSQVKELEEVRP